MNSWLRATMSMLLVLPAFLVTTGCTTIDRGTAVSAPVSWTVELLSNAGVGEVMAICALPMLFDGELLARESDVRLVVGTLKQTASPFAIVSVAPIHDGSVLYGVFAESFEIRSFIERHVPSDAVMVAVEGKQGEFSLLLGKRIGKGRSILGIATSATANTTAAAVTHR